jgi:hypothetical protein
MARIQYNGTEPAAPPGDSHWNPGEQRDIDDAEWAERLLRNPAFTEVKQTKAPPKGGAAPADQQQTAPAAEGS